MVKILNNIAEFMVHSAGHLQNGLKNLVQLDCSVHTTYGVNIVSITM